MGIKQDDLAHYCCEHRRLNPCEEPCRTYLRTAPQRGRSWGVYPRIPSPLLISGFCTSRLRSTEQARRVRRHRDTWVLRTRKPQHVQNTRGLRKKRGPATVSAPRASQNPSCLLSRAVRTGATFPATVEQRESLSESAFFPAPFLLEPSLSLPVRSRGLSTESSTSCAFLPHMPVPGGGAASHHRIGFPLRAWHCPTLRSRRAPR